MSLVCSRCHWEKDEKEFGYTKNNKRLKVCDRCYKYITEYSKNKRMIEKQKRMMVKQKKINLLNLKKEREKMLKLWDERRKDPNTINLLTYYCDDYLINEIYFHLWKSCINDVNLEFSKKYDKIELSLRYQLKQIAIDIMVNRYFNFNIINNLILNAPIF